MKILKSTALLLILIFIGVGNIQAQKTRDNSKSNPKKDATSFINRTNKMMFVTAQSVKEKQVYTGFLVKAKENQKDAIKAYNNKQYVVSVNKSYVARRYAFLAYKANGNAIPENWRINTKEKSIFKTMIKDEISDEALNKTVSDEDIATENGLTITADDIPNVGNGKQQGNGNGNGSGKRNDK